MISIEKKFIHLQKKLLILHIISYQTILVDFFFHNSFLKTYFNLNKINKINTLHIRLCMLNNYMHIKFKKVML